MDKERLVKQRVEKYCIDHDFTKARIACLNIILGGLFGVLFGVHPLHVLIILPVCAVVLGLIHQNVDVKELL